MILEVHYEGNLLLQKDVGQNEDKSEALTDNAEYP